MKPPFRAYDIRGKYPNEINEYIAYKSTMAFVELIKCKNVVVGRDHRLSSPNLHKSVISAFIDSGCKIIDIGLCTTPMLYFASAYYNFDGAVMITASHLPKEYNGLKFCRKKARALFYGGGLESIEFMIKHGVLNKSKTNGSIKNKNIKKDYERFMIKNIKKNKINIIVDTCHMMGYLDFKILKKISNAKGLFLNVNNNFPDHGVDPTIENNVSYLKKEVVKNKADLGIAFDGDCDRAVFVDNEGNIIRPDIITAIFSEFLAKKGDNVVFDMMSSLALENMLKGENIKVIRGKVGHSLIELKMIENKAIVGGEKSGHYYFKKFFYADNALMAAINLIKILKKTKLTSGQLASKYKISFISDELNYKIKNKTKIINDIEKKFSKGAVKILHLDGLSIYHKYFWINARCSSTQDIIRINIEGTSKKIIDDVKIKIKKLI